jgi:hypothetical protein
MFATSIGQPSKGRLSQSDLSAPCTHCGKSAIGGSVVLCSKKVGISTDGLQIAPIDFQTQLREVHLQRESNDCREAPFIFVIYVSERNSFSSFSSARVLELS